MDFDPLGLIVFFLAALAERFLLVIPSYVLLLAAGVAFCECKSVAN